MKISHVCHSAIEWLKEKQQESKMSVKVINSLDENWKISSQGPHHIKRPDGRFQQTINLEINDGSFSYTSPLISEQEHKTIQGIETTGFIVLMRTEIKKLTHYLVQAKQEPGNCDVKGNTLLAPSLQASVSNLLLAADQGKLNAFNSFVLKGAGNLEENPQLRFIRKDGGRKYKCNNAALILNAENYNAEIIKNMAGVQHIWMTRSQIREIQDINLVNEHLSNLLGYI